MKILSRLRLLASSFASSLTPTALDGEQPGDNYSVRSVNYTVEDAGSPWGQSDYDRRETMRVARYLYDYDGLTGGAIDMIVRLAFPVMPRWDTGDMDTDEALREYFETWAQRADFTGRESWWKQQATTTARAMVDGDIGVWVRKDQAGRPTCQLIEAHRIHSDDVYRQSGWFDGVHVNGDGAPTDYRVTPFGPTTMQRMNVSAKYMRLMRFGNRPTAYRGVSLLRRPAATVRDRKDILHYQKGKMKLNSWMPFFMQRLGGAKNQSVFQTPGAPKDTQPSDIAEISATLRRGQIPVLDKRFEEDLKPWNTSGQDANSIPFMDGLAREISTGLGVVTEFVWNPSMLANGTTQRTVIDLMSKRFREIQDEYISQIGNDIVRRVIAHAITTGAVSVPASIPLEKALIPASWQRPAELNIDRGKAQQDRDDILFGVTSMDSVCSTRASHWKAVRRQTELETRDLLARAKAISEEYNLPLPTCIDMLSFRGPNGIAVTYDEITAANASMNPSPTPENQ